MLGGAPHNNVRRSPPTTMLGGAPHLQRVALKGSSRQAGRVYGGRPAGRPAGRNLMCC